MSGNLPAKRNGGKNKGGRPHALIVTPKELDQIEALAAYLTQAQLAAFLGIGERTFATYVAENEDVAAAYARGRARAIKDIAQNLVNKARDGNMRAAEFYLKTQAGWSETTRTDFDGTLRLEVRVVHEYVDDADDPED